MENFIYRKIKALGVLTKYNDFIKDSAFHYILAVHIYILFSYNTGIFLALIDQAPTNVHRYHVTMRLLWAEVGFGIFMFLFVVTKRFVTTRFKQDYVENLELERRIKGQQEGQASSSSTSELVFMNYLKQSITVSSVFRMLSSLLTDFIYIYYSLYVIFVCLAIAIHLFLIAF